MSKTERPLLPLRDGVAPGTLVLPQLHELSEAPVDLLSFLEQSAHIPRGLDWENRFKSGLVLDAQGKVLPLNAPYAAGQKIHYWRNAGHEPRVPFEERIIYQDAHILVADKPHFLPVVPTGRYVQETLLVRLRKRLLAQGMGASQAAQLAPIHRIDRDTAGLVLFSLNAQERGAYMQLFRTRQVQKIYECIAPWRSDVQLPQRIESRLEPSPTSFMQMVQVPGQPNAFTDIDLMERLRDNRARYQLKPISGKRHQLRVQMCTLGLAIEGDGIYPVLQPEPPEPNYTQPLKLLAKALSFVDPLSGKDHHFESLFSLK
jgi:tRNA pseudouridine32 synthase / 23S rRNA pseudouridine746 synthase